jgi:hypothetical protein
MSELQRAAYHESGHAAAAVVLGLSVSSVTIERSTVIKRAGEWERYAGRTEMSLGDAVSHAVAALCGPAATRRWDPARLDWRDENDFLRAEQCIDLAVGDLRDISAFARRRAMFVLHVRSQAEKLAEDHWPEIRSIAAELLAARTLRGEAVERLFQDSLRARGGRIAALIGSGSAR